MILTQGIQAEGAVHTPVRDGPVAVRPEAVQSYPDTEEGWPAAKSAPALLSARGAKERQRREKMNVTGKQIVVLQRGWVLVGDVTISGDEVTISGASVVRRWGTSKGLGELAAKGPQSATILDPCGEVKAHVETTIMMIACDEAAWK